MRSAVSPQQHQRVRQLFDDALERLPAARPAFLKAECGDDAAVFEAVSRLIEAYVSSQTSLELFEGRFGRYVVTGEIGRGGMGVVYKAYDPEIQRSVAVKAVDLNALSSSASIEDLSEQLFREARLAGGLAHPGIVVVYDVGRHAEVAYIAMEHVKGPSVEQILAAERPLPHAKALGILRQVAAALDYAHQKGIIHRDVKPGNILLQDGVTAKVTDFGIATIASAHRPGELVGTPWYMSPEQIEGQDPDIRCDQYSLAVVAFEMLTGSLPFDADTPAAIFGKVVGAERPSATEANPALPRAIDPILRKGLARYPGERHTSCAEFVTALEAAFEDVRPPRNDELDSLLTRARQAMAAGDFQGAAKLLDSSQERFGRDIAWRMLRHKLQRLEGGNRRR
jgi:serine/threonine-protein kinase